MHFAGLKSPAFVQNFGVGYISVFLVMAAIGSALTAGHLEKRQVTKR
ncbi:hypothetical protein HNR03_005353 [Pseudomonas sp. JAI111]|nr:hypothetical protein [Pseudomonas sp. JAI111]